MHYVPRDVQLLTLLIEPPTFQSLFELMNLKVACVTETLIDSLRECDVNQRTER